MKGKISLNTKTKYPKSDRYQKHFTLDDRIMIQKIISENRDENGGMKIKLKDIGNMLQNDPSSISKEVKLHRIFKGRKVYSSCRSYNKLCAKYESCKHLCTAERITGTYKKNYTYCIDSCSEFEEDICPHLKHFPWVCNGCPKLRSCNLNKYLYYSDVADNDYKQTLKESREGINLTQDEFKILNHVVSESIKSGQPIYHIFSSNELPVAERTIYDYFEKGFFEAKNIDLRRKVSYKPRKSHKEKKLVYRANKQGRTYEDYLEYIQKNPDASIVEMDTVISARGSNKVLLTLHFVKYHFQLAYLLDSKEEANVTSAINTLCDTIGLENFKLLFEVILTDNGTEFSNPKAIEIDNVTGEIRSNVFYCHPYCSSEKGHCEKNHEYIRYILPKGTVFDFLTQEKCDLMMSHINSTKRPSLKGSPYDFMVLSYGVELLDLLKIKKIDSKEVMLLPKLLK